MQKYIIFLSALMMLTGCTGTRSKQVPAAQTGSVETSSSVTTTTPGSTDHHYVVNLKFTPTAVSPESGVKEGGEAVLLVIPSSEMFLAIYEGERLSYYYDFPNPLRSVGAGGPETALSSAMGSVWFPAWMADASRAATADIGIYAVTGYTGTFANAVQTKQAMQDAASKGIFKRNYTLNGAELAAFLKKI